MNILYIYSDEIAMNDIHWGLYEIGLEPEVYPGKIGITEYSEEEKASLQTYMQYKEFDVVITYNFSMIVATVCKELKVKYIAWVFDSPQTALYTDIAKSEYNYIFVFDKAQYIRMKKEGLVHLYHLPLAANVNRTSGLCISEEDEEKYSNEISFVGDLYQENGYNEKVQELDKETAEKINRIIQKIVLHWGNGYECFDTLDYGLVDPIMDRLHLYINKNQHIDKRYMLELYLLSRKITEIDRICILNVLAVNHNVTLYTSSDTSDLQNVNVKGRIGYQEEMPKVFYLSKINLNITMRSIETGIPQRVFDIMGVGGFVMSNYQEELAEYFESDKEIVLFHDVDELIEKVDYYLAHEEERIRIAINGYKKVRDCYNTVNAVKKMLEEVGKENGRKHFSSQPFISVVIPTYNREKVLKASMESVLNQSYANLELIIADDCSADQTERLVREMMQEDARIRYIRSEKNLGAGGARNLGASLAHGEYIAFNDSDAVWEKDKLEKQLAVFEKYAAENPGMVFHAYILSGQDKNESWWPFESLPEDFGKASMLWHLLKDPLAGTPTMMLTMEAWKEIAGFNEKLSCLEDYEFSLRVAVKYKIYYLHEPLITTYYSAGGVNQNWKEGIKTYFYVLIEFARQYKDNEYLRWLRICLMWDTCKRVGKSDFFEEQFRSYAKAVGEDINWLGQQMQHFIDENTTLNIKWDIFEKD